MRRKTIPGQLLRLLQLISLGVLYLFIRLAAGSPMVVETFYSQKVYPFIRNAVSAVTRVLPFALAEFLLLGLLLLAAVFLIVRIVRLLFLRKEALVKLVSTVITIVLTCSYLIILFYIMWGFNLYRQPVAEKLDLPEREYSAAELESVCRDLLSKAEEARLGVSLDENGIFTGDPEALKDSVTAAYSLFGASRPSFKADVPKFKSPAFAEMLSRCGISGIYVFLTEEPVLNTDEPFLFAPFCAAHETAHYLGYAREEEANFIALLVCVDSDSAELRYSGYLHALLNCAEALYDRDPGAYAALRSDYSEGILADIRCYNDYYAKYRSGRLYSASQDLNDSYLKFNGEEKGTRSYKEDVALIMRYYDSRRFFQPAASALISRVPLRFQTSISS